MRLYNTGTSEQARLDITVVPLGQRAVATGNILRAETDDDIAYAAVNIGLSVVFTTVLRDWTLVAWDDYNNAGDLSVVKNTSKKAKEI